MSRHSDRQTWASLNTLNPKITCLYERKRSYREQRPGSPCDGAQGRHEPLDKAEESSLHFMKVWKNNYALSLVSNSSTKQKLGACCPLSLLWFTFLQQSRVLLVVSLGTGWCLYIPGIQVLRILLQHVSCLIGVKMPENQPDSWKFGLIFRCQHAAWSNWSDQVKILGPFWAKI